jgi:PleD family two-component response regulator
MVAKIAFVAEYCERRSRITSALETRYEVVDYLTGSDALANTAEEYPDLIMIDMNLTDLEGSEVLRRFRDSERLRNVPAIALTSQPPANAQAFFQELGFAGYHPKPILDVRAFMKFVNSHVEATY